MVGKVGFEPTQPKGNRFTVCRSSPTLPLTQKFDKYRAMKPTIALYQHHPECSQQCCDGMMISLSEHYNIKLFDESTLKDTIHSGIDIIAFPGGIGDSDTYYEFFRRRTANMVADFLDRGGHYLGICMGAYWAGSHYFDLLDDVDAVQYIKRPGADVRRSYGTYASVLWKNKSEDMYFYDGCALIGDTSKFDTIATYANGDPMAIIQNRIGIIGCHPESQEFWYQTPWQYLNPQWHQGRHNNLLLGFVNDLMQR